MEKKIVEIAFSLDVRTVDQIIENVDPGTLRNFKIKRSDIEKYNNEDLNRKISDMYNDLKRLSLHDFRNKYLGNYPGGKQELNRANGIDYLISQGMISF